MENKHSKFCTYSYLTKIEQLRTNIQLIFRLSSHSRTHAKFLKPYYTASQILMHIINTMYHTRYLIFEHSEKLDEKNAIIIQKVK